MSWEERGGGHRYYTRSRKVGGRVIREYVGAGPIAELAALLDTLVREERARHAELRQRVSARLDAADAAVQELDDVSETAAQVALVAAGYHRHDRGEWRRRRGGC